MKVLVTGCGGFLGQRVVDQLLDRGLSVRGLGRSDYPALRQRGVELIRGDVRDADRVSTAVQGVDAVIHCAAIAGISIDWNRYHAINTQGTLNVIDACRRHGVGRLVHCSSPSVTFDGGHQTGIDESVPYPQRYLCHYSHTKALAEQAVLGAHRTGLLHTAALRPHLIWGADDPHLLPRLIDRAKRGRLRVVGDGQNIIDTVHVDNAAAAHLLALEHLQAAEPTGGGRAFFITQGEPLRCWDWIATLLQIGGAPPLRRRIGLRSAWAIGATLETGYRLLRLRGEPLMTRFLAAQLARDHYFDISAAQTVLGYRPAVTTEQGLQQLREIWSDRSPRQDNSLD